MSYFVKYFVIGSPALGALISSLEDGGVEKIAGYGILTVILAWFMNVGDKRLRGIEHSLNGMRRTILLDILARNSDVTVQRLCKEELRKVDPSLVDEFSRR